MRKKLLIVAAIFVLMLPASLWANNPGPGFLFDKTTSITMGGSYWGYSGGPFYSTIDGSTVPAYCVETGVYFSPGPPPYMADLYKEVGPVVPPVSDWFWYASYDINTFGLGINRLDQIATQYAVWAWAGEFGAVTNWNLVPEEFRARAQYIYGVDPGAWDDSGYRYADLYTLDATGARIEAQDQIVPVPEPMTMLLLGLGLIGVAGIRRKFKG